MGEEVAREQGDQVKRVTVAKARIAVLANVPREEDENLRLTLDAFEAAVREDERERRDFLHDALMQIEALNDGSAGMAIAEQALTEYGQQP